MLKSLVHEFQKKQVGILSCGILFLVGCGQPNDNSTTQSKAGEKGAATATSEQDDELHLDAPLEEPTIPTESKGGASKSEDAPAGEAASAP